MPSDFNPYQTWLRIPLEELPANHYRLLGLSLFERDPQVIEAAAENRLRQLAPLQTGKQGTLARQLHLEVQQVLQVLLDPYLKASYDQAIRTKMAARTISGLASKQPSATPAKEFARPEQSAYSQPYPQQQPAYSQQQSAKIGGSIHISQPAEAAPEPAATKFSKQQQQRALEIAKIVGGGIGGLALGWLALWLIGRSDPIDRLVWGSPSPPVVVKRTEPKLAEPKPAAKTPSVPPPPAKPSQSPPKPSLSPPKSTAKSLIKPQPIQISPDKLEPEFRINPPMPPPQPEPAPSDFRFELPNQTTQPTTPPTPQPSPQPPTQSINTPPAIPAETDRRLWAYDKGHYWKQADGQWFELTFNMDTWKYTEIARNEHYVDLLRADCPVVVRVFEDRTEVSNAGSAFSPLFKGRFAPPVERKSADGSTYIAIRACESFERQLQDARQKMMEAFGDVERNTRSATMSAEAKQKLLAAITDEKTRFEKQGLIPWSQPMRVHAATYLAAANKARSLGEVEFDTAIDSLARRGDQDAAEGVKALKRQVLAPFVVARIHCRATRGFQGEFTHRLHCNGKLNDPTVAARWTTESGALILHLPKGLRDHIVLTDEGKAFTATNNLGYAFEGHFADELPPHDVLLERLSLIK